MRKIKNRILTVILMATLLLNNTLPAIATDISFIEDVPYEYETDDFNFIDEETQPAEQDFLQEEQNELIAQENDKETSAESFVEFTRCTDRKHTLIGG